MTIRRLGLVVNVRKKEIRELFPSVLEKIPAEVDIVGSSETVDFLAAGRVGKVGSMEGCDAVLAFGGDGTFLAAARQVEDLEIPLLGIKIRSLGFLAEDDPVHAVVDLLKGRFAIQDRLRLEVDLGGEGCEKKIFSALNEAVIHGVGVSRVMHLKTTMDGCMLGEYLSDGVIVATPTGSTAYSLAAGGPIVNPEKVEAFIITPLCPHSLSVRPLVVSSDETFTVELVEEGQDTLLTVDGQQACTVRGGENVVFRKSPKVTRMIVTEGYCFADLVRRKLGWGGVLRGH